MRLSFCLLLMSALGWGFAQGEDSTPRVAVISAFAPENTILLEQTEIEEQVVINGRTFTLGRLAGNDVVLFLSGVSMVNAAMTTQLALDHFEIGAIVVSGIAGGVNPELSVGDVTVPSQWGQYQEQFFARETEAGYDTGFYSEQYDHYEFMFPKDVEVTSGALEPDAIEERFWFPVDAGMLELASGLEGLELSDCSAQGACLERAPALVAGGNGVSGSTFVDNADYREWVWDAFEAQALDMETAAVAHVAYVNGVPYIAFRSLSDLAGGGPGENEIGTFFQVAADNSAAVVVRFLEALAASR